MESKNSTEAAEGAKGEGRPALIGLTQGARDNTLKFVTLDKVRKQAGVSLDNYRPRYLDEAASGDWLLPPEREAHEELTKTAEILETRNRRALREDVVSLLLVALAAISLPGGIALWVFLGATPGIISLSIGAILSIIVAILARSTFGNKVAAPEVLKQRLQEIGAVKIDSTFAGFITHATHESAWMALRKLCEIHKNSQDSAERIKELEVQILELEMRKSESAMEERRRLQRELTELRDEIRNPAAWGEVRKTLNLSPGRSYPYPF